MSEGPGRRRRAVALLLALAGLGVLGWLVHAAGPAQVLAQLRRFGWGALLFLVPSVAIYLLDALGWRLTFLRPPAVGFWRLFLVRAAGESVNNGLPSAYVLGEPVKAVLLRTHGEPAVSGAVTVTATKLIMTAAQTLFVAIGTGAALWSRGRGGDVGSLLATAVPILAFAVAGLLGAGYMLRRGFASLAHRAPAPLQRFLARACGPDGLAAFDQGMQELLARPGRVLASTGVHLVGWLAEIGEVLLFTWLLGLPLGLAEACAIAALATVVKGAGFFVPGSLGVQESGNVALFLAFGLAQLDAVTFSLLRRARELLWIGLGFAVLAGYGLRPLAASDEAAEANRPAP